MADRGLWLRRRAAPLIVLTVSVALWQSLLAASAQATPRSWKDGEHGSGPPPSAPSRAARGQAEMISTAAWGDLEPDDLWARTAIDHVAGANDWMRDVPPASDGTWRFKPDALETREKWARAIVRAFARDEAPDPSITFPDIEPTDRYHRFAAVAVKLGWMARGAGGRFNPDGAVNARQVHRSLVFALGMRRTAVALDHLSTTGGYAFDTPKLFGATLLGMRLGLRYNNKGNEAQDVTPTERLRRKQAAWSLYRATTLQSWVVPYLEDQYADIALPAMGPRGRSIVDWGVRYVGFPYIWAGEWGFTTTSPAAFGTQPGPGFDCSGISWWALRRDEGAWQISPPRPHEGWSLPQRTSAEMSRMTKTRLRYADLRPGDLMFYDGDGNGTVDHVDVYVGNGWALDSSSSVGGVTLMWVQTGWYRQHFVHGRRILP
ncbi:MAG TPA: NlpC/P60 family protein [Actinomycetota bacterium]|nr:NlpC/P60 family protein [Actinomycetota bacterium]